MDCLRGNNLPAFVTFHLALLEPGVSTPFISVGILLIRSRPDLQTLCTSIPAYDRAICIIGQEAIKVGPTGRYALCVHRDMGSLNNEIQHHGLMELDVDFFTCSSRWF
jgi:hypothetical protein